MQPQEQAAVAHLDQVQLVQRAAAAVQKLVTAKNHQKADLIHHSLTHKAGLAEDSDDPAALDQVAVKKAAPGSELLAQAVRAVHRAEWYSNPFDSSSPPPMAFEAKQWFQQAQQEP
jgi:hypothetical protein